jgi:hypothetical protein
MCETTRLSYSSRFQDPQADNPKLFNLRRVALTAGAIIAGL